jgi:signal transduction histidine kinase
LTSPASALFGRGRVTSGPGRAGASRVLRIDVLVALVVGIVLTVGSHAAAQDQVDRTSLDAWAFALAGVAAVGLAARRTAPLATFAVDVAAVSAWFARGYPYGPMLLAVILPAFTVGTRCHRRTALGAAAIGAAAVTTAAALGHRPGGLDNPNGWLALLGPFGWVIVPAVVGLLVRSSRLSSARADTETARLRAEQARLQVAREVHDVIGHGLSVISLQAGVALHVLERRPEQAQVALEAIRRTSIDALAELRETLAVTSDPDGAAWEPLTGLARLAGLAADVRLCGLPLDVQTSGIARPLAAEVDLAAFRVAREGLTNVLRHAGPAQARVTIGYLPGQVVVEVADTPLQPPDGAGGPGGTGETLPGNTGWGTGRGLSGLRARVTELGGTLSAGPPGAPAAGPAARGWVVRAVLPTATNGDQELAGGGPATTGGPVAARP